jgi:hydroxyacylglutathione hydrolase
MSDNHTNVSAIKAFSDNYIWAISNENNLALVDPGDAQVCIEHIEKNNLLLSAILITHHHNDHIGGIEKLLAYANTKHWTVTVYGPKNDNIVQLDVKLSENDTVILPELNCEFTVIDLPGHTHGHIAYHNDKHLFCGDTLFSGGCGRIFEGTPAQMHQSLSKLAKLAGNTLVYCAHEYTLANLTFALAVEPKNAELHKYTEKVKLLRHEDKASIPTSIDLERQINPFLRCHTTSVKQAATNHASTLQTSEIQVFATIRAWKDNF